MKYAIKVTLDDDQVYVTDIDNQVIKTYDTKEVAEEHAKLWTNSIVVEYMTPDEALDEMVRHGEEHGLYNEHGYCPNCGINFDGDLIFDTFMEKYQDEETALESASHYGATKTKGRWGHKIGIYDMEKDMTTQWKCPDCDHIWDR